VKLSIVMPVYNEKDTIREILAQVRAVGLVSQIVVVEDCSKDGTREVLQDEAARDQMITLVMHDRNRGKGASVRSGIERATGDIVIIQDADLEYDPRDYPTLIRPIQEGRVKVVYGSRFLGPRKDMLFWHMLGNKLLTLVTNILYDSTLSDMETCYKVMRADVAKSLNIKSDRWGIDPEITAKVLKRGNRIFEVPISYYGREYYEGKKISWRDGFVVLWTLIKYRFVD
jgi:glycosyltransferase involved in cell wall biosynthesis